MKVNEDDTIGDLKKLIAAQVGTRPEKFEFKNGHSVQRPHHPGGLEIHDGMGLEMYYN